MFHSNIKIMHGPIRVRLPYYVLFTFETETIQVTEVHKYVPRGLHVG